MCGKNLKNQYSIEEEIKSGWKPENACYLSMQNVVSSSFIFTITICGDIILPVVLHGCEIWSLILREVRSLRMFGNSVLSIVFRPNKYDLKGVGKTT